MVLYVFNVDTLTILRTAITSSYDEKTTFEINYWTDIQTKLPGQIIVGIGVKVIFIVGVDTLGNSGIHKNIKQTAIIMVHRNSGSVRLANIRFMT